MNGPPANHGFGPKNPLAPHQFLLTLILLSFPNLFLGLPGGCGQRPGKVFGSQSWGLSIEAR